MYDYPEGSQLQYWWWAGFATSGVVQGYFMADGARSLSISRNDDDLLIQRATDFAVDNSFEELVRTNEVGLPKKFIEELRSRSVVINRNARDLDGRCKSALYETAERVIDRTIPIGPMSYVTKRYALRKIRKKLNPR